MELKYYLRGLGLGIIVTAIIMAAVSPASQKMTDVEVIRRAKQLGMTEEKVLSDSAAKNEDASGEDASGEADSPDENASGDENEEQPQEKEKAVSAQAPAERNAQNTQAQAQVQTQTQTKPEPIDAEPEEPDASEVGEDVELERQEAEETNTSLPVSDTPMVVTIGSGDGSYAVSKKLADVGAISSPGNFDTFLCENGYDKKIRPGTYTIPADASDEQMARIITGAE